MNQPLAQILRPQNMNEVLGQSHLIGEGKPLTLLELGKPQSIILWGPPGVGKTTIANILIKSWNTQAIKFSAVLSGIKEIRDALDIASQKSNSLFDQPLVLFVDEIHRFNKAQQDAFLHHLEDGSLILIGATTENPSFALNSALLSRVSVYVLNLLTKDDLLALCDKAQKALTPDLNLTNNAKNLLVDNADGDARKLLNMLEHLSGLKLPNIDIVELKNLLPNMQKRFDNGGEEFYNQISALHKSVRGSDPDAALFWFMQMLQGGTDPLYLGRRILRMAWEDIGLANIDAVNLVNSALASYERLGSPEGELALAAAVVYLASSPKSNAAYVAYKQMQDLVRQSPSFGVPYHLRNAPTKLMVDLGYGKEYRYPPDYPHSYLPNENYWPQELSPHKVYNPTENGEEKSIKSHLEFLKSLD